MLVALPRSSLISVAVRSLAASWSAPQRTKTTAAERMVDMCDKRLQSIKGRFNFRPETELQQKPSHRLRATKDRSRVIVSFVNNGFLGLQNDLSLHSAYKDGLQEWGLSSASRYADGDLTLHKKLEKTIAKFLGKEDCAAHVGCYAANLGLINQMFGKEDVILMDALNHSSIWEGVMTSEAQIVRHKHRDVEEIEKILKTTKARHKVIITEGVFSMDATFGPIDKLVELAEQYDALLMVDDSHGVGVLGDKMAGAPDHFGVHGKPFLMMGTLNKALGSSVGGYVAGPTVIMDFLRQVSRTYNNEVGIPPTLASTAIQVIENLPSYKPRRDKAIANAEIFRKRITEAGFPQVGGNHPIIPVVYGSSQMVAEIVDICFDKGYYLAAIPPPIVPEGLTRFRVVCTPLHEEADINRLADIMIEEGQRRGALSPEHLANVQKVMAEV